MAIAYYVPPEYGPPQQQQAANQNNENPPIVDVHQQHFHQDANNNNVMRRQEPQNNQTRNNQLVLLFTSLVNELLAVFGNNRESAQSAQRQTAHHNEQSIRNRRQAAQQLPNLNIGQEQDNQPTLPDLIPSLLPDIVSCHADMSFRYNSRTNQPTSDEEPSTRHRSPVAPLSPTSSNHNSQTMDIELSVKLEMSVGQEVENQAQEYLPVPVPAASPEEVYRLEGARLRAIADSFELSRTTRRHRPSTQSTFELKIVISVALPTVALVGLGLAYLRRC